MCFGWTGAYHRSVEDWSSSVWTGKKDGFELQDNTFFLRICRFSCCSGACKREAWAWAWQKFHDPLVNWTSHWMLHNSKKWKKATVSLATGSKSERLRWDPQEICFFFFSLVLPLASMVFFSNPELGGGKSVPRSRTFQKWNDDLDPEIGRWATWLRKLGRFSMRRLRWGLGFTKQTSLMTICQSCQLHLHLRNSLKLTEIHAMHLWREKPVAAVCTWHGWRLCDDFSQKIHKSIEWLTGPLLWPPFFHCSKRLGAEDW